MARPDRGTVVSLPYVHGYRDRHGKLRRYFRKRGWPQIPLPGRPGSPEFQTVYAAALAGLSIDKQPIGARLSAPGSVSATLASYYTDNSFLSLAPGTQRGLRWILERFRADYGDLRIAGMAQTDLALILGKLKPSAAKNWLKAIRRLMQYAKTIGLRPDDPTQGIKTVNVKSDGFHTWTEDEIATFERSHAVGTRARLALGLLLYTAARRGDVVGFGPQHIRAGRLHYRQQKTGKALAIPVHPALAAMLNDTPTSHLTFLVTPAGAPYKPAGFSSRFRKWCNEAGLPHCAAHGLRKAQARRLAEAGCSAHEIASITGHRSLREVQRYTEAADQARLAKAAFERAR